MGQRAGDQLGALLAGAYSLVSDGRVTYEQAEKWIKERDWSEEASLNETKDEQNLFVHIMEQPVMAEGAVGGGKFERTIGELMRIAAGFEDDGNVTNFSAKQKLARCGIRLSQDVTKIIISNKSDWINRVLSTTAWGKNYPHMLIRIDGATKTDSARFGGTSARGVAIPMETLL